VRTWSSGLKVAMMHWGLMLNMWWALQLLHVAEPSNGNRYFRCATVVFKMMGCGCNLCLLMLVYLCYTVCCTNVHHTVPYFTIMRRTIALKSSNSFFRNRWGYNEIVLSAILQALVIANGSGELAQDVKLAVSLEHRLPSPSLTSEIAKYNGHRTWD